MKWHQIMNPDYLGVYSVKNSKPILLGAALLLVVGCHSIGPGTVAKDRFDYSTSIADSWKQQTLLNIVKLRYLDLPVFVDVASIVAGYSMQTGVSLNGTLSSESAVQGDFASIGGQAIYTDRPTITYTPLTGQKFLQGLLTPIEPKNIFFMLQSGYAADFVLGLTVESLNGVHNRSTAGGAVREADPEFGRALQLLREVQVEGAVGMRVLQNKDKTETAVVFFRRDNLPQDLLDKLAEIRRLLKVPPDQHQFNLIYSPTVGGEGELAVGSRSMLQIMQAMASFTEVPEADVKEGRALPSLQSTNGTAKSEPVKIKCSPGKPVDAYAAVRYRDQWFWVDDRDLRSKRAFTAIMFIFTMVQNTGDERLPLVTISAQYRGRDFTRACLAGWSSGCSAARATRPSRSPPPFRCSSARRWAKLQAATRPGSARSPRARPCSWRSSPSSPGWSRPGRSSTSSPRA